MASGKLNIKKDKINMYGLPWHEYGYKHYMSVLTRNEDKNVVLQSCVWSLKCCKIISLTAYAPVNPLS